MNDMKKFAILFGVLVMMVSCSRNNENRDIVESSVEMVSLQDVALLLSSVDLGEDRVQEVYDAVSASSRNGYDEEYTMKRIFEEPGSGVGEDLSKAPKSYSRPLRDVFVEHFTSSTKAGGTFGPEEYLEYLRKSDMQIYWPYCEDTWDGVTMPVITFDPLSDAVANIGYYMDEDGRVHEVVVDEAMAMERPVWVVNRNSDAGYMTLDLLRQNNPEWSDDNIVVRPADALKGETSQTKAASTLRTLVLKDFCMNRNYDTWFRGASEFFIKMGAVESFSASTEAELRLYDPAITDFVVVVKRSEVGEPKTLNTLLISDWTSQLETAAFMVIEDDGGTVTNWNCSAIVKINSKSYGFELTIPYRSYDDIVWRGQLSRKYIEANNNIPSYFGDIALTFSIL